MFSRRRVGVLALGVAELATIPSKDSSDGLGVQLSGAVALVLTDPGYPLSWLLVVVGVGRVDTTTSRRVPR
jgi:hypothetical protein